MTVGTPPPSTVVGVSVTPNPVAVGQAATITVTGTNPCTMLWMDFGDGDWWIAPISGLPFTTTKTWTTAGNYTVYAAGYYTCSGSATRAVTVTGVPAPTPEPLTEMAATAIDVAAPERVALAVVFGREGHFIPIVRSSRESLTWSNEIDIARQDDASGELRVEALAGPTVSVPDVTVLVDLNGTGSGTVTGGGVTCSGQNVTCSVTTPQGSSVTLTATPQANMIFTGWTGACAGVNPTCTVEAYEHRVVVANFSVSPAMVTKYYHLDGLGSVRATTDAGGAVVERHDYRPFGEDTMPLPDPGADPARFLGQQRDSTKLDQFGARYYSMFHGRFSSIDPGHADADLVTPQSWNAYAYARNNPLRFVDPSGLATPPYELGVPDNRPPWIDLHNCFYLSNFCADEWLPGNKGGGGRLGGRGPAPRPAPGDSPVVSESTRRTDKTTGCITMFWPAPGRCSRRSRGGLPDWPALMSCKESSAIPTLIRKNQRNFVMTWLA